RLAEDDGPALTDDLVRGAAERRIRSDAGPAVGAAALECDDELRRRHGLTAGLVRGRQEAPYRVDAVLDRALEAAVLLDRQHQRPAATASEAGELDQVVGLIHLAAE